MEKHKSKIIIEDYKNNFKYKKNESSLNIQFNRVAFIFFVFFIIYLTYTIHLIHLGSRKSKVDKIDIIPTFNDKLYRADIIDINGVYIAKTVSSIDIGIKTSEVINKKILLINLKNIFPKKNFAKIENNLIQKKFFWLEKKISEENYEKIMKLGDKSIKPEERVLRIYPQKNLFSHIIGQIDDNNNGISGLEKSFNETLRKSKKPIKLTVDKDIQFLVRKELAKYQEIFRSKGSAAILMNVNNGNIVSLVSLPDFNPNERKKISDVNYINRVTKGTYELGSVFKTFTIASGINAGLIEPDTEFLDSKKSIKCGKNHTIKEYDNEMPSDLTAEQILIKSGNIGSVRIARKIGIEEHKSFLKSIGVIDKIDFDIEEVGSPQSIDWYEGCKLETISFGHGITTTILQLAKGYAILSNGGFDIKPTLVNKNSSNNKRENRLLKKGVSEKIVKVLRKIVNTEEGTAKFADVSNYEIAGKTGTAQQPAKGEYTRTKINTFASIFPSSSPKYVFVIMMDSPKTSSSYVYNYRHKEGTQTGTPYNTAGWTSVEVAGKIIDKIGPILATKYIEIN
jgi:cell division protein FtsI (penicillin-binding protein 3)